MPFRAAAVHWVDDYAQSMDAALAFYTMFSIAPFLLIVTAVAGLFFGEGAAEGEIFKCKQVRHHLVTHGCRRGSFIIVALQRAVLVSSRVSWFAEPCAVVLALAESPRAR